MDAGTAARITDIPYVQQEWNGASAASLAMVLGHYAWEGRAEEPLRWLRPNANDKSVSPWEMVRYVTEQTHLEALSRPGGTLELLTRLIDAGFPVILQTGLDTTNEGWTGHYRVIAGYDEAQREYLVLDSYLGRDLQLSYAEIDAGWQAFNRTFIVVYPSFAEDELQAVLDDYADPAEAAWRALETARAETAQNEENAWAWFNVGSSYIGMESYENAAIAYDRAFELGLPFRMLWHQFGPYEAYYHTGRYQDVLQLAESTLSTTEDVEETYYWMGMALAETFPDKSQAVEAFEQALDLNPNFAPARDALDRLEAEE
jgi:tetratricopeptide (TPR) repeat protein